MSATADGGTRRFERWGTLIALILALITVAQQVAWVHLDATRTRDDDARLYAMSLCLADVLGGSSSSGLGSCIQPTPYPPLVPLVAAVHFLVSGDTSIDMAVQSLWIWYVLLVVFLYVGVRRESGVTAGLAAAALGPVVAHAHFLRGAFYTEIPLMATTVAAVVALVNSRGFRSAGWSSALGLILGAGLMVKWTFAFFLGPPMVVFVAVTLARLASRWRAGVLVAVVFVVGVISLAGWAGGLWPRGGGIAVAALASTMVAVAGLVWKATERRDALRVVAGLALCLVGIAAVAGPWYIWTLPRLRDFIASNLAMRYDGDFLPWTQAWHYYPAVLLTRGLGTPLGLLFLFGSFRVLLPGRRKVAVWSLAAFLSGLAFLTLSPYRTARYLAAGYGLVVPVAIPDLGCWRRFRVAFHSATLFCALFVQLSWIPPAPGGLAIPIPFWLNTPPPRELFGNIRGGIQQAWKDLTHPRWHIQALAPAPVRDIAPTHKILAAIASRVAPGEPLLAVLWDPDGRANADALRIAALAAGFPEWSRVQRQPVAATLAELDTQRLQIVSFAPPGNRAGPIHFFIITVTDGGGHGGGRREEPVLGLLKRAGFVAILRERLDNVGSYVVRVWMLRADPRRRALMYPGGASP